MTEWTASAARLFASYSAAWAANDPDAIAAHWSASRFAWYKAEEIGHFFTRWADITAYWAHNATFHDKVSLQFSDINILPLGDGYAHAIVRMRWDIRFASGTRTMDGAAFSYAGTAMGGNNHLLCLLHSDGEDLRLCGWSETPDAPITYMAQLYQKDVTPGF